jgi:putative ABC transport system permease protein
MGLRLALRTLRRSPWYAATAIGTIALSISLAATVFAIVDGVLFKPLPYANPDQLYQVAGATGSDGGTGSLSPADVRYLTEADTRIRVTGFSTGAGLTHPERADLTIWSAPIDRHFFDVLSQYPLVGGFTPDHYQGPRADGEPIPAIVSHAFWQQWLGGDPSAVGRTIAMVNERLLIVGVLPRDFVFPSAFARIRPDVLRPLVVSPAAAQDRWSRSLNAVARLRHGITMDEARSILSAALAARVGEYSPRPQSRTGPYTAISMRPLDDYLGATERPLFRTAFAGAALLIILGAINVGGLFAARGRDRARELTIRIALGAGRAELARAMLIETFVVALIGSATGLILAAPLLKAALALLPPNLLLLKAPAIDWRVILFAVVTATAVVTIFALVPAAMMVRTAVSRTLSAGSTNTARVRSWGRSALLVGESAIGIALVVAGSLMLTSFVVLRGEDAGFDPEGLAVLEVRPSSTITPGDTRALHGHVFERIQRAPGVSAVATVGVPLLENMYGGSQFTAPPGANRFFANDVPVSGAFFDVARLRLMDGRMLTSQEIEAGRPFAVVSERTAREYWPTGRAVGQTLSGPERTVTVIGVVEEARFGAQDETRMGEIYVPAGLSRRAWTVYLLRTAGEPDRIVREVALAVQKDVNGVLVRRAESFDTALGESVPLHRFRTALFGVAACAGMLLLAVGVGGLVATGVARRVREIGIRAALGAQSRQLIWMIVLEHLRPLLAGVGLGLLASWWSTRLLSAFLYQVDPHDPRVWFAAAVTLLLGATVAAWIPASRAAGAPNPMVVLRIE